MEQWINYTDKLDMNSKLDLIEECLRDINTKLLELEYKLNKIEGD